MNRVEMLKLAYARGAYLALCEAGYQEKVAEDLAIKIADRDALDALGDVGLGAGIGGLGGAALGAGGGALASRLMGRNLLQDIPKVGPALHDAANNIRGGITMENIPGYLRNGPTDGNPQHIDALRRLFAQIEGQPQAASALAGGAAGAGMGALGGGLVGGLAGE